MNQIGVELFDVMRCHRARTHFYFENRFWICDILEISAPQIW